MYIASEKWVQEQMVCDVLGHIKSSCIKDLTDFVLKIHNTTTKDTCKDFVISNEKDKFMKKWFNENYLFFASNQFNSEIVLFEFIFQLLEFLNFVGEENSKKNIFISFYENGSTDNTDEILRKLYVLLRYNNYTNVVVRTEGNLGMPKPAQRIQKLAIVRNRGK